MKKNLTTFKFGAVDRAANSGPYDPSSIPLGEKKDNRQKRGQGWPISKKPLTFPGIA